MKDLLNNSTVKALITAARHAGLTGAGTKIGTVVDLAGEGRKLLVAVNVGTTSTATLSITIQESADSVTFTTLGDVLVIDTTGLTVVDLTPTKRYIRAMVTLSETSVDGVYVDVSVEGLVYNERYIPSNVT